jgi:hypothetical protein
LKSRSEELAKKLGYNDFKATGDKDSAEQWKSTKLPNLLQKFSAGDIYSANETS